MGSGWLGLPLAKTLEEKKYVVNASTTSSNRLSELSTIKVNPFLVNIGSLKANIQTFLQAEILIINIPVKNIDYFISLIKAIKSSGIKKVIFVSSTSVYGNINRTLSESDGLESPDSPLFKIETVFKQCKKFETTIIRFGGLIGYSRNPAKFFSPNKPIHNPDSPVNLIHRDDCIGIIIQIIKQQVWGESFNCCADTHPTKKQFYTYVSKATGFPVPIFIEPINPSFKIIDNKKVKEELSYKFVHPDLMDLPFSI